MVGRRHLITLVLAMGLALSLAGCAPPAAPVPTRPAVQSTPGKVYVIKFAHNNSIRIDGSDATKAQLSLDRWLIQLFDTGVGVVGLSAAGEIQTMFMFLQPSESGSPYHFLYPKDSKQAVEIQNNFERDVCEAVNQKRTSIFKCLPSTGDQGQASLLMYDVNFDADCEIRKQACNAYMSALKISLAGTSEASQGAWSAALRQIQADCTVAELNKLCTGGFQDYDLNARMLVNQYCKDHPALDACKALCKESDWKTALWCSNVTVSPDTDITQDSGTDTSDGSSMEKHFPPKMETMYPPWQIDTGSYNWTPAGNVSVIDCEEHPEEEGCHE